MAFFFLLEREFLEGGGGGGENGARNRMGWDRYGVSGLEAV